MRTTVPWTPNDTGLPDPFFMRPREYLEALNELEELNADEAHERFQTDDSLVRMIVAHAERPCDPDTFHPTGGWAVPKRERHGRRKDPNAA